MEKQSGRHLHGGKLPCWAFGSREATASGGRESGSERGPCPQLSCIAVDYRILRAGGGTHFSSGEKSVGNSRSCFRTSLLLRETVSRSVAHFYGHWAPKCASIWAWGSCAEPGSR